MLKFGKAYLLAAICCALPFVDERLFLGMWIGLAGFLFLQQREGAKNRFMSLYLACGLFLFIPMSWAPSALSAAMGSNYLSGLLAFVGLLSVDAFKLALPIWLGVRCAKGSMSSWIWAACFAILFETWFPTVFPWKVGYAFVGVPVLVQASSLLGPSLPTLLAFSGAGLLNFFADRLVHGSLASNSFKQHDWDQIKKRRQESYSGWLAGATFTAILLSGIGSLSLWNEVSGNRAHAERDGTFRMVLVQADPSLPNAFQNACDLSQAALSELEEGEQVDLVCWPESIGGTFDETTKQFVQRSSTGETSDASSTSQSLQVRECPNAQCPILLGADTKAEPDDLSEHYVSALMLDSHTEEIAGRHDKRFLMPFGEYVPLWDGWPSIQCMTGPWNLFLDQPVQPICAGNARIGVMLCYEDMIPKAARDSTLGKANVLMTLADGSAFKSPLALRQHRMLAQMRAIETRRTFVRCTSTGETCVISPTGSIISSLPRNKDGWLLTEVELYRGESFYTQYGNQMPLLCMLVLGMMVLIPRLSQRKVQSSIFRGERI